MTDGGPANTALIGKWLQQVPRTAARSRSRTRTRSIATVALGVQIVGLQYNDDLNVNFIPAATLASAGYDSALSGGPAGLSRRST